MEDESASDSSDDNGESDEESLSSELPEVERRFMPYNPSPDRHHNNSLIEQEDESRDVEGEDRIDDDEIGLIAEREFIEENSLEAREQLNNSTEINDPQTVEDVELPNMNRTQPQRVQTRFEKSLFELD